MAQRIAILMMAFLTACTMPVGGPARAVSQAGDPALDGKDYLLSASDFRSITTLARQRVAQKAPWLGVRRIHVVSADKVTAYVGQPDDDLEGVAYIDFQRIHGTWRIMDESYVTRVIVT